MQTTLRIRDDLYRRAKAKSSELGLTLTRFFEEAAEERLARLEDRPGAHITLPVSSAKGPAFSEDVLRRRIADAGLADDNAGLS